MPGFFASRSESDPTAGWPAAGQTPPVDLEEAKVGPLRLGDPLEGARALGRPLSCTLPSSSAGRLEYQGYELEFKDGRLVCATFNVAGSQGVHVGGLRLSRSSTPQVVRAHLGEPASDSCGGGGLRWVDYVRGGATLALEFDAGGLSCVQLYADGYA